MANLRCPRCGTVVAASEGQTPVCPNCGFGSSEPAAAHMAHEPAESTYGAPASTRPAAQQARPWQVTLVAVLDFIGAGFAFLGGLLLIFGAAFIATLLEEFGDEAGFAGDLVGGLLVVIGIVVIALGVLYLFMGLGFLKGQKWAWIVQIVFSIIGALGGVIGLVSGDFENLVDLVIYGLLLWALFAPSTRAWFEGAARRLRAQRYSSLY